MATGDAARADLVSELYARENPSLIKYLAVRTRCRTRAEDLAQLAWVKVLAALRHGRCVLPDAAALRAYLYTVARNTFLDECTRKHESVRTRSVDPADLDALAPPGSEDRPDEQAVRAECRAAVRGALARLPAEQRVVIVLWSTGTSAERMAAHSGAPVDTVLSRKKYAFARMRRELQAFQGSV